LQDHAAEFSGNHEASVVDIKDSEECLWKDLVPIVPHSTPSSIGFVVVK
jgi:hypothetical protein